MTRAATLLTSIEIEISLQPLRAAATALRVGVATELQWDLVRSAIDGAEQLERRVLSHGLAEHLQSAHLALQAIGRRALVAGAWRPIEIYLQEIEHIDTAVDLHEWQLQQLSAAEARRHVLRPAVQLQRSQVVDVDQLQGVLA